MHNKLIHYTEYKNEYIKVVKGNKRYYLSIIDENEIQETVRYAFDDSETALSTGKKIIDRVDRWDDTYIKNIEVIKKIWEEL